MIKKFFKFNATANKCGINDFKCGTCKACQKADNERWNTIWKQKFAPQESRYYSQDALSRQEQYSQKQSSLATNWPVLSEAYSLAGIDREGRLKKKAAGRGSKAARMKKVSSPA